MGRVRNSSPERGGVRRTEGSLSSCTTPSLCIDKSLWLLRPVGAPPLSGEEFQTIFLSNVRQAWNPAPTGARKYVKKRTAVEINFVRSANFFRPQSIFISSADEIQMCCWDVTQRAQKGLRKKVVKSCPCCLQKTQLGQRFFYHERMRKGRKRRK